MYMRDRLLRESDVISITRANNDPHQLRVVEPCLQKRTYEHFVYFTCIVLFLVSSATVARRQDFRIYTASQPLIRTRMKHPSHADLFAFSCELSLGLLVVFRCIHAMLSPSRQHLRLATFPGHL
jgi:hypothetical protein